MTEHRSLGCRPNSGGTPPKELTQPRGITRLPSPSGSKCRLGPNIQPREIYGSIWCLCVLPYHKPLIECSGSDNSKKLILSLRDETAHFRGSDLWAFIFEGHLSPPTHTCTVEAGWRQATGYPRQPPGLTAG